MPEIKTVMDVFRLLEKSNCKKCNAPTCLAFAAAVFKGEKQLNECPHLSMEVIRQYAPAPTRPAMNGRDSGEFLQNLLEKLKKTDLKAAADRLGETFANDRITVKMLGKDVSVDSHGRFYTDIHVHSWVTIPLLSYITEGRGEMPTGTWLTFRELKQGMAWQGLFAQTCEKPLKKLADQYTGLFYDLLTLFNGRTVDDHYESDLSMVLKPLPRVWVLIRYLKPEEGMDSDLVLLFDRAAEANLSIEAVYSLGTGLAAMFGKIALRHGG